MTEMMVQVVTPDKVIYEGPAYKVIANGMDGIFTVMKNHSPMLTSLGIGEIRIERSGGNPLYIAADTGILEVASGTVRILSDDAVLGSEINQAQIKLELERVERQKQKAKTREELLQQEIEVHKLLNRLQVSQRAIH